MQSINNKYYRFVMAAVSMTVIAIMIVIMGTTAKAEENAKEYQVGSEIYIADVVPNFGDFSNPIINVDGDALVLMPDNGAGIRYAAARPGTVTVTVSEGWVEPETTSVEPETQEPTVVKEPVSVTITIKDIKLTLGSSTTYTFVGDKASIKYNAGDSSLYSIAADSSDYAIATAYLNGSEIEVYGSYSTGTATVNVVLTLNNLAGLAGVTPEEATRTKTFNVKVYEPVVTEKFAIAKKASKNLTVKKYGTSVITAQSSNKKVFTITKKSAAVFTITAKATGSAYVIYTFKLPNGVSTTKKVLVKVTDPQFAKSRFVLAVGAGQVISLKGVSNLSSFSVKSSSTKIATAYASSDISVYGKAKGACTITAVVDGKTISTKLYITQPYVSNLKGTPRYVAPLEVNGKVTVKVSGLSKYSSAVKYKTENAKIATVSSSGKITAKKIGSTNVTATVDGKVMNITVTIAKKNAVNVIKKSLSVLGYPYSQAYRMKTYYFDCSSFVWRMYKSVSSKYNFGTTIAWAPTAAAEGQYLVQAKKAIASKALPVSKLRAGDIILMDCDSTPNYRFRGIDHAALYLGDGYIIHSNWSGRGVTITPYSWYTSYIKVIGRII